MSKKFVHLKNGKVLEFNSHYHFNKALKKKNTSIEELHRHRSSFASYLYYIHDIVNTLKDQLVDLYYFKHYSGGRFASNMDITHSLMFTVKDVKGDLYRFKLNHYHRLSCDYLYLDKVAEVSDETRKEYIEKYGTCYNLIQNLDAHATILMLSVKDASRKGSLNELFYSALKSVKEGKAHEIKQEISHSKGSIMPFIGDKIKIIYLNYLSSLAKGKDIEPAIDISNRDHRNELLICLDNIFKKGEVVQDRFNRILSIHDLFANYDRAIDNYINRQLTIDENDNKDYRHHLIHFASKEYHEKNITFASKSYYRPIGFTDNVNAFIEVSQQNNHIELGIRDIDNNKLLYLDKHVFNNGRKTILNDHETLTNPDVLFNLYQTMDKTFNME